MKVFWEIFKNSIKLPKRKAAFALNRIGMDMVILYMFLLLALASIPDLINQFQSNTGEAGIQIQPFFELIFFFIFYYLIMITAMMACISLIAYIGTLVARAVKRKLRYAILWKMAACVATIPILVFIIISFFYTAGSLYLVIALVFHLIIFIQTIFLYPKRRHIGRNK